MNQWQFGYMVILGAVAFPLFYLGVRQLRRFGAWANREEGPRERTGVYIVMFALLGIFAGGLSQGFVDIGVSCSKQGKPVIGCTIGNMFNAGKTNNASH